MNEIASVTGGGDVTPRGGRSTSDAELAEIRAEWTSWRQRRDAGEFSATETFMAELNRFTDWVATEAPDSEVDALSDDLLLALLDLRQTVVRRLSDMGPNGK